MNTLLDRILSTVGQHPGCSLEDVQTSCTEWGWNQVFLEVDRLSREGAIELRRDHLGVYRFWLVSPSAAAETVTRGLADPQETEPARASGKSKSEPQSATRATKGGGQ